MAESAMVPKEEEKIKLSVNDLKISAMYLVYKS